MKFQVLSWHLTYFGDIDSIWLELSIKMACDVSEKGFVKNCCRSKVRTSELDVWLDMDIALLLVTTEP